MITFNLQNPVNKEELKAGDNVMLSGVIYTARDAAHKKITSLLADGGKLPFEIKGAFIYYAGPTPAKDGMVIGSCGPTTSGRMDVYTPKLLDLGLAGMLGKGERSLKVIEACKRNKAVYFCAIGGAGALAASCVKECEVIAFPELGCESVKRLVIENFPAVVAIDTSGNDLFKTGREQYKIS